MASTVRSAFQEFSSRLELTDGQRNDASTKHTGVKDCLNSVLWVERAFLTGSFARRTIIRPPNDIDLFVVLESEKHANDYYHAHDGIAKALTRFHGILKGCYPDTPIRKDLPAIHLDFANVGFDVIPAFHRSGGGFLIPGPNGAQWMATNPVAHADMTSNMNSATNGYFVPLVKMLKSWNVSHYRKLTGFHIEVALHHAWPRSGQQVEVYPMYSLALNSLLSALAAQLSYNTPDPAGLGPNIDNYLSYSDRQLSRERLMRADEAAGIALRHEARNDHRAAISKWREVFGDLFPIYS